MPYVPALDGLRGIALCVMLVYHGHFSWIGGGYLSVSTFFTLSGFLITALLSIEQQNGDGAIDLAAFWGRRLRRLMPAALAGIAVVALYAAVVATPGQLVRLRADALAALLYVANFRFMTSGHSYWEIFSRPSPLQHYWSLSIEEQFYLLYPLLLVGVAALARRGRASLRLVLVTLAVASTATMAALSWSGVETARIYYGTDTRASEFLVGAVLATLLVRDGSLRVWRGRGFAAVNLLATAYVLATVLLVPQDAAFLYRGGFAAYSVATAVLINAALQPGTVTRVLSWRPLVWMGTVSYGAYIYHWPIYLALDASGWLGGAPLLALQIAATFAAAQLSYVFLERPIRERRWLTGTSAALAPIGAAAAIVLAIVLVTAAPGDLADRRPKGPWAPTAMPDVTSPARSQVTRVMVLGDSVAWTLGRGFSSWARRNGESAIVWNVAVYGCGLARGHDGSIVSPESAQRCDSWPDRLETDVDRFRPDVVVVLSGHWDLVERRLPGSDRLDAPGEPRFDDWLLSEYLLAVDIASSHGAHVVWLTAPCLGPEAAHSPLRGTAAIAPESLAHLNRVLLPRLAAARPHRVTLFDLFDRLCPGGKYVAQLPWSHDLRPDGIHIGKRASAKLAGDIIESTWPALGLTPPTLTTSVAADQRSADLGPQRPRP